MCGGNTGHKLFYDEMVNVIWIALNILMLFYKLLE